MRLVQAVLAAIFLSSCATGLAGGHAMQAGQPARRLTVVGINDTHGALLAAKPERWARDFTSDLVGGADWFAGYLAAIRAEAKENSAAVIVLDAGDMFQGTLISNAFKGKSVVDTYDALGVTAAAVGNHEFDFGIPVLEQRIREAHYPILLANAFNKGTRTRPKWAHPTALVEVDGVKVGIIGLATVETPLVTNPLFVQDLEFAPGGPIAAQLADELHAQGATVVLVTAHAGPLSSTPPRPDSQSDQEAQRIAEACRGRIDGIVSGHNHTAVGPPPLTVAGIPIVQAGSRLTRFSVIDLDLDATGHATAKHVNEGTEPQDGGPQLLAHTKKDGSPATWRGRPVTADATIAELVHGYDQQVAQRRETRLGSTEVALQKGGPDDLLGNFAADALRSGAGGGLKAPYAFQNPGGLRIVEIPAGPISFGQIFDLSPFDNEEVIVTLKASDIRDALESILRAGKGPLKVSGLTYTIDWTRHDPKRKLSSEPAGSIVTEVVDLASGRPLCRTESCTQTKCQSTCAGGEYPVAVTDFLANGGDGMELLKDKPRQVSKVLARDILIAFLREHDPITAALLGSVKAGGAQRIRQQGEGTLEHE
ncbi:MAG TPA: bifunctional UDP-sugar hydrolase/5'-nucleotidase [Myxococcales bacterium]|nr:bifunctional UDP-sugar hydrolase/5'-nucleotidase [Myxococcales bacterium]